MSKGLIIKIVSIVVGAIIAISLVTKHPVHIAILGACAGAYFIGEAVERGKNG